MGLNLKLLILPISLSLTGKVDQLLKKSDLPPESIGVEVRSMQTGEVLYEHRADQPMNPASGLKILVAATSLSKLGPNYRFLTRVGKSGKDVCLVGGGDPSLVYEELLPFVLKAKRDGIQKIEGDFLVDASLFPISHENAEDFDGDKDRAFTAPISPLSLNYNSLTLDIRPTEIGAPPSVQLEPELSIFKVVNKAKTFQEAGPKDVGASIEEDKGGFRIEVFGKVGKANPSRILYRAVPNPALYAAYEWIDRFVKEGGEFHGKVRMDPCATRVSTFTDFESKPLSLIVHDMNKFSNNFIAEMLLRALGDGSSPEKGLKSIKDYLAEKGIPASELKMNNASGLSESTQISARTLTQVLQSGAKDPKIGPELMASLGIAGTDGTLKKRFKNGKNLGELRAKSGMIRGVVSLTGIVPTKAEGPAAFSILINTTKKDPYALMQLEEEILSLIAVTDR